MPELNLTRLADADRRTYATLTRASTTLVRIATGGASVPTSTLRGALQELQDSKEAIENELSVLREALERIQELKGSIEDDISTRGEAAKRPDYPSGMYPAAPERSFQGPIAGAPVYRAAAYRERVKPCGCAKALPDSADPHAQFRSR